MTDTVKPMRARRFARPLNTEPRIGCEARPAIPEPSTSELTAPAPPAAKPVSKIARILVLLQREEGATLNEMVAATSWLPHTTRAAMTGLKSVVDGTGGSFSQAQRFVNEFIADGLVPATNAINAYKNLALRGYDTSQIEKTLLALKDAAAFGRQSSLSIGEAVQSATEGLKNENSILVDNAGVTKNVAKMWADYAKSIGTTATALTKQQKIQAEVQGIMEETRFQTGDAAKLTQGYAGQVAALSTSFYNMKVAVGNAIIPVLQAVIPAIKSVVDNLTVLFNQFARFMAVLFGVKLGIDGVADSAQGAADGTNEMADATERAEKAAKGALAAFAHA